MKKEKGLVTTGQARNKALVMAKAALSLKQRMLLYAIVNSSGMTAALRAMELAGTPIARSVAYRWKSQPRFRKALELLEADIAKQVTRDSVVKNSLALLDEAMAERPILHEGKPTGFTEVNIGHALKANEQLARATKAWGDDEGTRAVVHINLDFMTPQYDDRGEKKLRDVDPYADAIEGELVEEEDDSWLALT